jgi:hypothetical protein
MLDSLQKVCGSITHSAHPGNADWCARFQETVWFVARNTSNLPCIYRKRHVDTPLSLRSQTIAASGGAIAAQQVGSALGDILDGKFQAGSAVMCIAKGNMAMRFPMGDAVGEPLLHFKS